MNAESGRQIERFFKAHPDCAPDYSQDPFWERRAIAARYIPINQLEPLLTDSDEAVRASLNVFKRCNVFRGLDVVESEI